MQNVRMWTSLSQRQRYALFTVLLLLLLCLKFFWTLALSHVPLGYDVGIYRYLFVRHADGFPPFDVVSLPPWAKGHPLGLFFFTTILMRIGVPVSWLIGWIWNLFPVLLAALLGWVIGRREGKTVGLLVMLAALLSVAYFDGFAAMYWKTYASLFWCVLTYHLLERRSWLAIITGILTVATHHQTGLLFGLAFGSWVLIGLVRTWISQKRFPTEILLPLIAGVVVFVVGLLWYVPVWQDAVAQNLTILLQGDQSPGGNFPSAFFYIRTSGILLAFGIVGLLLSFKRERFTLWQLSVLWCLVFVGLHLLFFRRFFLQLDFFLLPFAAIGVHALWQRYRFVIARTILVAALLIQLVGTALVSMTRTMDIDPATFASIESLSGTLPRNVMILVPENQTTPFVQGWFPYDHVAGPGLFESTWSFVQWKSFILGAHDDRVQLLSSIAGDTYLFASPFFMQYYGQYAAALLHDSCFHKLNGSLYKVVCK